MAIIDGEHYAPVVRDAFAQLPHEVVGAVLVGGTEKLRGGEDYGVPLASDLGEAIDRYEPELVFDLSDEPVLTPRKRLDLASRALALGLPYAGPGYRLDPPQYEPFALPSLAVIGTGKRVGKTALTGHLARLLSRDREVVVVSMGRGGPPEPELVEVPPTLDDLLELARTGRHAASDHLELAALVGVVTIGCRRCGAGMAGEPATSSVAAGAAVAAAREPDVVIFDGSGAAIPPVAVDHRILVADGRQDVGEGLNPYRLLISDLVVLTGGAEALRDAVRVVADVPVVRTARRLRPLEPLSGKSAAVFTTGPAATEHLDADVVHVSRNLADREALREELHRVEAEVYIVELKAAAIDVVAETARTRGAQVVLAENELVPLSDEPDLDTALLELVERAVREQVTR
ncbi:MAG: 2,3-diphosphoglycerate synthetase [Candidatus Rokuibacteriota bacterium]|nr:MAG: 2,3-diphosphoglycerate synthetase [Candidatus Rokubacteria bacterium]